MAGRITYQHPELHNDCGWVSPIILSKKVITQIEAIIGRVLTNEEIASISESLARIKTMGTGIKVATNQDVKRTLASFSKLSPIEATEAYRESDATTQLLTDEALGCNLGFSLTDLLCPSGEDIKKAASVAHNNLAPSRKRRPIKGYRKILATYTLNLWKNLGMKDCKPWHNFENAAPIIHLMVALVNVVDGKSMDFKDAVALLLKEVETSR